MMEAVFVDGVPARITMYDFRRHHLQSFPDLESPDYDSLIMDAIEAVYAMFTGVGTLWDLQSEQVWFDKTTLCYRLLTAWLITDQYPELAVQSPISVAIKKKRVDGVDVWFNTDLFKGSNPLDWLLTNEFGRKALLMIRTAAKRTLLRNCRFV